MVTKVLPDFVANVGLNDADKDVKVILHLKYASVFVPIRERIFCLAKNKSPFGFFNNWFLIN